MKLFILLLLWCLLFIIWWPAAIIAIVLFPVVWLLSIPFRLVGMTVNAAFALLGAILFLPARLLGYRRAR